MNQFRLSKLLNPLILLGLVACQAPPASTAVLAAPTVAPAPAPTTFSSKILQLPIRFNFGPEWHVEEEYTDDVALLSADDMELAFIVVKDVKVNGPEAPFARESFPDDFVTWIQTHELFQVIAKQSVSVAGLQAMQIDATATAACGTKKNWLFLASTGWNCTTGQYFRFIDLPDVNGEHVLVMENTSPQAFAVGAEESQKVLDTVAFAPPTLAATVAPAQGPTTFTPQAFKLPLSLHFNSDWQVTYDLPGKFGSENVHDFGIAFYDVTSAKLTDPLDGHLIPFPEDFPAWVKSDPDFQTVGSTSVTVAGIEGQQLDVTPVWKSTTQHLKLFLSLSGDITRNLGGQPDGENIVTDPERWRFILLKNVKGERLLLILIDGNGHQFEDAAAQTQAVLNTVSFTK